MTTVCVYEDVVKCVVFKKETGKRVIVALHGYGDSVDEMRIEEITTPLDMEGFAAIQDWVNKHRTHVRKLVVHTEDDEVEERYESFGFTYVEDCMWEKQIKP